MKKGIPKKLVVIYRSIMNISLAREPSNTRFPHAPVCSLCEMNRLTNRRRSDGTVLDGRHGIYGLCDGSSWHCITK